MPLDEIADVVSTDDLEARNQLITSHLDRLERAPQRDPVGGAVAARPARFVDAGLDRAAQRRCHPRRGDHRRRRRVDELGPWFRGAFGELDATLAASGVQPAGPAAGLYDTELFAHGVGAATVFVPVSTPIDEVGRVARRRDPGRRPRRDRAPRLPRRHRPGLRIAGDLRRRVGDLARRPDPRDLPHQLPRDLRHRPMVDRDRLAHLPPRHGATLLTEPAASQRQTRLASFKEPGRRQRGRGPRSPHVPTPGRVDVFDDPSRRVAQRTTQETELEMCRVEIDVVDAVGVEELPWMLVVDDRPEVVLSWTESGPVPTSAATTVPSSPMSTLARSRSSWLRTIGTVVRELVPPRTRIDRARATSSSAQ